MDMKSTGCTNFISDATNIEKKKRGELTPQDLLSSVASAAATLWKGKPGERKQLQM
jgi:hypothetical protein